MLLKDIEQFFDSWAPQWTAWERDNVGLQVGRRSKNVKRILVALDPTEQVVKEAARKKVDLIVTHHPLFFHPPSSVSDVDPIGRMAIALAENGIALFSAHTNLDAASGGVSHALAKALGVEKPRFLMPLRDTLDKLVVFVPEAYVRQVRERLSSVGAGVIGEYEQCTFRVKGTGTFHGSASSRPFTGTSRNLEEVDEVRLEILVPRKNIPAAVAAMKEVHPYEEIAYDVYPVGNSNPNFGMGAVGDLVRAVPARTFLDTLKKVLHADFVRYTGATAVKIKRVAVCGGAGAELLENAIRAQAEVFVTADIRYHSYHAAAGRILLVDAGHWETEQVIVREIVQRLRAWAKSKREPLEVTTTEYSTNPIHSY